VQSAVTWTLGANVEDLTLTGSSSINGTGNTLSNALAGNAAANVLSCSEGNDLAWGAAGNDTLAGGNGNDVLQGGDGNDTISDTTGNNVLDGGLGADTLTGASGGEILIGGRGDDTITAGSGADVFAFNKGDGRDTIVPTAGADDTLSLGGGIRFADLGLRNVGSDLLLDAGTEQVTIKDWYAAASNHRIAQLQMVTDASTDYLSSSTDSMRNRRVARFDFAQVVAGFDAALAPIRSAMDGRGRARRSVRRRLGRLRSAAPRLPRPWGSLGHRFRRGRAYRTGSRSAAATLAGPDYCATGCSPAYGPRRQRHGPLWVGLQPDASLREAHPPSARPAPFVAAGRPVGRASARRLAMSCRLKADPPMLASASLSCGVGLQPAPS
jgi:hypothetical protein